MKITLLTPVEHDGKVLEVGASVDLPKAAAEALVATGAAEPSGKATPAPAPADGAPQG